MAEAGRVLPAEDVSFDAHVPVLVIGAGAAGLTAALAAAGEGAEVMVLERDASPAGSTAMSSGFVPAAGTRAQAAQGIEDGPATFAADIQKKAKGLAEPALVDLATREIGPALDWLAEAHGVEWRVLDDFLYPGHARHRMHAVAERTGEALLAALIAAAGRAGFAIATGARVTALHAAPDGRIAGVAVERPGGVERIGCGRLVLACNGYGGNRDLVARHIPAMADAPYWGHAGNTGDAVVWGEALGAEARCLSACQGHGSLAHPHGVLITWALMMEGGIQVNAAGRRFSDEHQGYSEQSVAVLAQPGGVAWCVFDARLKAFGEGFPDLRAALAAGAVRGGGDVARLAAETGLPEGTLAATLADVRALAAGQGQDAFGRDFTGKPALGPELYAVKVTGALFHTQGGLMIGADARVLRADGTALPNLHAVGGAACGVSGPEISGYLSGNGLLTAIAFGRVAGRAAGQAESRGCPAR